MLYVLGANGFIGNALMNKLQMTAHGHVVGLRKKEFDITNSSDYRRYDFNRATIIDCITKIDGAEEDIMETNYVGLRSFLEYLNAQGLSYKYIYFSTTACGHSDPTDGTPYVRSKYLAEQCIADHVDLYTIIRLTFPFGRGEGSNRLISRLIRKISKEEPLILDAVKLNLTPIDFLLEHIPELINSEQKLVTFTDGVTYDLPDIVDVICRTLKKPNRYTMTAKSVDLTVPGTSFYTNKTNTLQEIARIASEAQR